MADTIKNKFKCSFVKSSEEEQQSNNNTNNNTSVQIKFKDNDQ